MKFADIVERRLLFAIARVVFLTLTGIAIVAILADFVALSTSNRAQEPAAAQHVSAAGVLAALPSTESSYDAQSTVPTLVAQIPNAKGLRIAAALNDVLTNDDASLPVLNNWLGNLEQADRQPFLDGLAQVVALAGQHAENWEWDNRQRYVAAAMNRYAHEQIGRMARLEDAAAAAADRHKQYMTFAAVLLGMIAVLTLILVLLAIERNTRPSGRGERGRGDGPAQEPRGPQEKEKAP